LGIAIPDVHTKLRGVALEERINCGALNSHDIRRVDSFRSGSDFVLLVLSRTLFSSGLRSLLTVMRIVLNGFSGNDPLISSLFEKTIPD
jgi:hypothetical protein